MSVNTDTGTCEAIVNYSAPTASDGCGNVTVSQTAGLASGSAFPVGTTTNSFVVTDDCGNTASCSFDIIVTDNEDPVIICPADQTVDPGVGNPYTVPDYFGTAQATVTDNCTNPVTITSQNPTAGTMLNDGAYTVTLTAEDQYGNTSTCSFTLTVDTVLGINDPSSDTSSISLYPNPTSNEVTVNNPQMFQIEAVSVYTINGRMIKILALESNGTEIVIDLSDLANGNYILVLRSDQGEITRQLLKE